MQAATLSRLLLQGSAAELQKVQEAVALDPTRLSAALLALLAVPVVAWSEYTLKVTGQCLTCIVASCLPLTLPLFCCYWLGTAVGVTF